MFALAYRVGAKYGGWATGALRFGSHEEAQAYQAVLVRAERLANASPVLTRVISA